MGDWVNAVVKFKPQKKYVNALNYIFDKRFKRKVSGFDWFDYFYYITEDGEIDLKNCEDEEYLRLDFIGYNMNLPKEYSIGKVEQGIDENGICTILMSRKWTSIENFIPRIESNLESLAEEILYCEIVGMDNNNGVYYDVICDNITVSKDEYGTTIDLELPPKETWQKIFD